MSKIALKLMVNKGFGCLGKVNMLELKLGKENMITIYALCRSGEYVSVKK